MAFNIRKYLGLDGGAGVVKHDNTANPIPDDLLNKIDKDINELISYITGASTSKPPTNAKEVEQSLNDHIAKAGLEAFYDKDHPLLKEIARRAEEILNDPNAPLNKPAQVEIRAKGALYDVVIYCDDSYSMQTDNRIAVQKQFAARLCDIITPLVPNDGIKVRFINDNGTYDALKTTAEVERVIGGVAYNSYTQIGTMMEAKILQTMLYPTLPYPRTDPQGLRKPIMVIIITDGWPYNEDPDHFKNVILKAKAALKAARKGSGSVLYSVNQIGNDPNADAFIKGLHEDQTLSTIVHCTSEKLDYIASINQNNVGLDNWVLKQLDPSKFKQKPTTTPP